MILFGNVRGGWVMFERDFTENSLNRVKAIGNMVNQTALRVNSRGFTTQADVDELRAPLEELSALCADMIEHRLMVYSRHAELRDKIFAIIKKK